MARYRAGIIGLNLGRSHARGYDAADGIEIVAMCDIDAERLAGVADEFDVPGRYTSAEDMLRTEALDIVSVATPAALHARMTLLAARFPVQAIIAEKPLANSMGEAESMLTACDAAGIKLLCGYQGRHFPVFQQARDLIADGAIGTPLVVKVGAVEGGLSNQGSHLIDRALYVLGDPEPRWVLGQVQRETDRYERGYVCEELCFGIAAVEGGGRLVFYGDIESRDDLWSFPSKVQPFVIAGDDGSIIIEPEPPNVGDPERLRLVSGNRADCVIPPESKPVDYMRAQAEELVQWLDGAIDGHRQDAHHTIKAQAIMMGLYESARSHTLVEMPVQTKVAPLQAAIDEGSLPVRYPGAYDTRRRFVYPTDRTG